MWNGGRRREIALNLGNIFLKILAGCKLLKTKIAENKMFHPKFKVSPKFLIY